MASKISPNDIQAIKHITYVADEMHDLTNELYEDLMERDHEEAKIKATNIISILNELIYALTDEV